MGKKTRKFTKEFMIAITDDYADGVEIIENDIVNHTRWAVQHEIVFKYEDKYYSSCYQVGATESQDELPYEYDDDEIEVNEVEKFKAVKYEWVCVEE